MDQNPDRPDADAPPRPFPRALVRAALWLTVCAVLIVVVGAVVLRTVIFPQVDSYRPQLVATLERALGQPLEIGEIEAGWEGLRPRLTLHEVRVASSDASPALSLERVEATLAWASFARLEPHFDRLALVAPRLVARRDGEGAIRVAGREVGGDGDGSAAVDWLLRQREIVIDGAELRWEDEWRAAPKLELADVNLRLVRVGGRYRFNFGFTPPERLAGPFSLRGDVVALVPSDPLSWMGQLFVDLERLDVAMLQQWVSVPYVYAGNVTLRAWMDVEQGHASRLFADLSAERALIDPGGPAGGVMVTRLGGRLHTYASARSYVFSLGSLDLELARGERLDVGDLELELRGLRERRVTHGRFEAEHIELASLVQFARHVPLPPEMRDWVAALEPHGRLSNLRFEWVPSNEAGELQWEVDTQFDELGMRHHGHVPGLVGLRGRVAGDNEGGQFEVSGRQAALDFPEIFPESRLVFDTLQAAGGWGVDDGRRVLRIDEASFDNADAAGSARGAYWPQADSRGEIELEGHLTRAEVRAVWRYLPWVVNETVREWLRDSLTAATVPDVRLELAGQLDDFPFDESAEGVFRVDVEVRDGVLQYDPDWPRIEAIDGLLRFDRAGMFVEAAGGRIFDVTLQDVSVAVPDLGADDGARLAVQGAAQGPTASFLRYVRESPLHQALGEFVGDIEASGSGTLTLALDMPLSDVGATAVEGSYSFSGNRVRLLSGLPALESARGRVGFTENSVSIAGARAEVFGHPLEVNAETDTDGTMRFRADGAATVRAVRQHYDWPWLEHLSGTAPWRTEVVVGERAPRIVVQSALAGVSSSLPAPLNKRSTESWPTRVEVVTEGGRQSVDVRLADWLAAELRGRIDDAGGWRVEEGGVGLNRAVNRAEHGVLVSAELEHLDLDAWREIAAGRGADAQAGTELAGLDLAFDRLRVAGQDVRDVVLGAVRSGSRWSGRVESSLANGSFEWDSSDEGALVLRLDELDLGARELSDSELGQTLELDEGQTLPAMDIVARRFRLRGMDLGRLELRAHNEGNLWQLEHVALITEESGLRASGRWRSGSAPRTELTLDLETSDLARLLRRLGQPEAVDTNSARLSGDVAWRGLPTRLHYGSLEGQLSLQAGAGRFRELEPGVGRLLGVLSLQSLPRRLKLDFSDVFSEGFAFDGVSGSIDLERGVARTDDLHIAGPAARIWIEGSADLARETQDLLVLVKPTLSESVAIGAAAAGLINPVAGVIAFLAQKALRDPVEQMFAFGYAITGKWADPQVSRLEAPPTQLRPATPTPGEQ